MLHAGGGEKNKSDIAYLISYCYHTIIMDFLASLQIDSVPEQATRAAHLAETLADDPDLRLGFNACCTCARKSPLNKETTGGWVKCKVCRRVKYCSEKCLKQDATQMTENVGDDDEQAVGHTPVICRLLRLCNEDEDAEDPSNKSKALEAARDRVRSELESYPATLANILVEGPCYQGLLRACRNDLAIHVIGASEEAELWGQNKMEYDEVWDAYGEALLQLVETYGLKRIHLHFIGPDCPRGGVVVDRTVKVAPDGDNPKSTYNLHIETHKSNYIGKLLKTIPKANIVVFFNPGFTCPDYQWDETMECLQHEGRRVGFLITTNTEMEGVNDCQYLLEKNLILALPPTVAAITDEETDVKVGEDDDAAFFAENPYAGSRVRQNGTMANDLYVRNRWMYGGIFAPLNKAKSSGKSNRDVPEIPEEDTPTKKKTRTNEKRTNPALI
jgi:hypothetical protein